MIHAFLVRASSNNSRTIRAPFNQIDCGINWAIRGLIHMQLINLKPNKINLTHNEINLTMKLIIMKAINLTHNEVNLAINLIIIIAINLTRNQINHHKSSEINSYLTDVLLH